MSFRLEDLGDIMFKDRTKRELNQEEYAAFLGVAFNTVRNLEQKKHANITMNTLAKIAKAWNMPTIELNFSEPSSEEEAKKYRDIVIIMNYLYQEDSEVVEFIKDYMPTEIEKAKRYKTSSNN